MKHYFKKLRVGDEKEDIITQTHVSEVGRGPHENMGLIGREDQGRLPTKATAKLGPEG